MNTDDSSKLIERYFLGTISETEMECLDAQLQSDTAFREAFAAMARLDTTPSAQHTSAASTPVCCPKSRARPCDTREA